MFPTQEEVRRIRERYPVGTKIVLDHMGNDPHPIPDGTKGTVAHVDDAGTVHCTFENGRYLGLIPGEDSFHIVKERTREEILSYIDPDRVVFWVYPEERLAFEAYYNPDSASGGQLVFNSFTFHTIEAAEAYCHGDPKAFYEYLDTMCNQECIDITDELETLEDAVAEFGMQGDYEGHSQETMTALIRAAHDAREKAPVQKHKTQQER